MLLARLTGTLEDGNGNNLGMCAVDTRRGDEESRSCIDSGGLGDRGIKGSLAMI